MAPCKNTGTFSLGSRETTENPIINFLKVGGEPTGEIHFFDVGGKLPTGENQHCCFGQGYTA